TIIWGRSKWTRSAADSNDRTAERVDQAEWVVSQDEALRIVPDELWNKVQVIQTEANPRREAVRKGISKRASGHGSRYWLGTLLVCAECGSNYIGDGLRDYLCPAYTAGSCSNNMRFRREDTHIAAFDLLRKEMLSDERIAHGQAYIRAMLEERAREEDAAVRQASDGAELRALDNEIAELRRLNLRPAMLAAGIEEIEREKAALLVRAESRHGQ